MITRLTALVLCAAGLMGCQSIEPRAEVRRAEPIAPAPLPVASQSEGCWATDQVPAVMQTVYDQDPTTGAQVPRDVIAQPAETRLFAVPCPDQMTPDLMASLQRALSARGFYAGPVTSVYDDETAQAVRQFQATQGLNSARLSLEGAQILGLIALPRHAF